MAKKKHIEQFTVEELDAMAKRGESKSNWTKAEAMNPEEIEAAAASDSDEAEFFVDWSKASVKMPQAKANLNMRIDRDILEYFRKSGRGYQTKINAILRSYVEQKAHHHKHG